MDQKAGWFEQIVVSFGIVVVYPLGTLMSEWVESWTRSVFALKECELRYLWKIHHGFRKQESRVKNDFSGPLCMNV